MNYGYKYGYPAPGYYGPLYPPYPYGYYGARNFALVIVVVVLFLIIGGAYYYYSNFYRA
ncbi:hypothetical protein [Pseudalkalibacillus caeni]|uniref:hypothetical protein n=1 Tax=Exobacillus caeni TaxID=2574798 RepID=UPI00148520BD|nr:hypothetical protein [Pseudalkalibacillus caeni]